MGLHAYRESCMEGGAEGDNGVEGGTVSQPASAHPAENVGDGGTEGRRVKFATRHGVVVVGGMEKKYRCKRAAVTVTESCSVHATARSRGDS